jgi:cytochrome c1
MRPQSFAAWIFAGALLTGLACISEQDRALQLARQRVGGDPDRGAQLIQRYGCGGCHRIPGIAGAAGSSAPALEHLAAESYLPGSLPNTPENVVRWIEAPRSVLPQTRMPMAGVSHSEARDIATYLWSLR